MTQNYEVKILIHLGRNIAYLYCLGHCLAEELDLEIALGGVELLGIRIG